MNDSMCHRQAFGPITFY